jgi:putative FmdB family regulatory protein
MTDTRRPAAGLLGFALLNPTYAVRQFEGFSMPIYEYDCADCGDFTLLRPMADRDEPCHCPACGSTSKRVILSAPCLSTMAGSQRRAHAANERSAHAPQTLDEYKQARKHPAGCGCCSANKPLAPTKANPHAMKGKPAGRPWMISH